MAFMLRTCSYFCRGITYYMKPSPTCGFEGNFILTPRVQERRLDGWVSGRDMSGKCVNVSDNNIQYIWSRLSGWLGGIKLTKTFSRDYKTSWEKILVDFSSFIVSNFWPGMSECGDIKKFLFKVIKCQLIKIYFSL